MHHPVLDRLDRYGIARWLPPIDAGLRGALRWVSHHTGVPVMLVAAVALVASAHLARRTLRFAVEVAIALGLLFVATRLGWLAW